MCLYTSVFLFFTSSAILTFITLVHFNMTYTRSYKQTHELSGNSNSVKQDKDKNDFYGLTNKQITTEGGLLGIA